MSKAVIIWARTKAPRSPIGYWRCAGQKREDGGRQAREPRQRADRVIRLYAIGLLLHGVYFADEVTNFAAIPPAESHRVNQEELKLRAGLIDQV